MRSSQNSLDASISLPTQADIERRLEELIEYQDRQRRAGTAGGCGEPLARETQSFPAVGSNGQNLEQTGLTDETDPDEDDLYPGGDPEFLDPPAQPLPTLCEEALHGLAGLTVQSLAPHTEADPAAVLLQFLAAFGNLVGRDPHCRVGPTRHGLNLFLVLVGESSKARKGTSWRQISSLFAEVDPGWAERRILTARPTPSSILSTLCQQGAADQRLFVLAEEFASVLHIMTRENAHLSPLLRSAWDGADLATHNGHRPLSAAPAHLSLVGHITQGDLAPLLGRADSRNGFANRCLWASVRRSRLLPDGGNLPSQDQAVIVQELRRVLEWIRSQNELVFTRTPAASELWNDAYSDLAQSRPDAYGAATSRAEAQVLRLSALYAALDASPLIDVSHLRAALAVWDYCRASARLLFDNAPIDPIAVRINEALGRSPQGLSRMAIRALFHGHVSKERIDHALQQLIGLGLTSSGTGTGRGRPTNLWIKAVKPSLENQLIPT
jgi:hypothetical protein